MAQHCKVSYRPIEAAIRWCGLVRHEQQILRAMEAAPATVPCVHVFPKWPCLRLNTERIYDGIMNAELRCAVNGVALAQSVDIAQPDLTVRHLDLKAWMMRYYPDQRPAFLFSRTERAAHPTISIEAVQVLVFERDSLRERVQHRDREIESIRIEHAALLQRLVALDRTAHTDPELSPRSEATYLHIVGGLLNLLVGCAPSGQPYSSFRSEDAVMSALVSHHGQKLGISERTLQSKFALAKRTLAKE